MNHLNQNKPLTFGIGVAVIAMSALLFLLGHYSFHSPPNFIWSLFSGYYQYDPRIDAPPPGIFLDRPEPSLKYFMDATLRACNSTYPSLSRSLVIGYEIERVEFLGYSPWAFVNMHTRLNFEDGQHALVTFQMRAGHNEAYSIFDTVSVNTGSWQYPSGLFRDPKRPPPGWITYERDDEPLVCDPTQLIPFKVETAP